MRITGNSELFDGRQISQERASTNLYHRSSELPIESGVNVKVVTTQYEAQECWSTMCYRELHSLELVWPILNKTDSQLLFATVTEVDEGPNSFDIIVGNRFEDVGVFGFVIMCCEEVASLSLPDGQSPISKVDISVRIVPCKSGHEVPWRVLSVEEWDWVAGSEPQPETVPIL